MTVQIQAELARRSHAERTRLTLEMHSRKLPRFAAPARVLQLVVLAGETELDLAASHIAAASAHAGEAASVDAAAKHAVIPVGEAQLVWERHTEFATYGFILPGQFDDPFALSPFKPLLEQWLERMPGEIFRSSHIAILPEGDLPNLPTTPESYFDADDLIVCDVLDGQARIWSDFRMHDGFGRMLVAPRVGDRRVVPELAQTLLELGNYRKLALLGLPEAQRHAPDIRQVEQQLARLSGEIDSEARPREDLLHALTRQSAKVADLIESTRYRMSATKAYAAICDSRVASLRVSAVDGGATLVDFTQRRLHPAVNTCNSFTGRLDDLAGRLSWTTALLRTRIDTEVAAQNRDLLKSMDRRNALQLRLQQTVEGLSIAAISYYVVGLIGHLAEAAHALEAGIDPELATGLSVPLVLIVMGLLVRRLKHSKIHHSEDAVQ